MSSSHPKFSDDLDAEEMYVLLEVSGVIDAGTLFKSGHCRILGLATENPILQIGNNVFTGEYKETMGTAMFFTEKEGQDKAGRPDLKYLGKTDKRLELQRVILKPKKPLATKDPADQAGEDTSMK